MKPLTDKQKKALKQRAKHHSPKHLKMMRDEMQKKGKTFEEAHQKAKRKVGK